MQYAGRNCDAICPKFMKKSKVLSMKLLLFIIWSKQVIWTLIFAEVISFSLLSTIIQDFCIQASYHFLKLTSIILFLTKVREWSIMLALLL